MEEKFYTPNVHPKKGDSKNTNVWLFVPRIKAREVSSCLPKLERENLLCLTAQLIPIMAWRPFLTKAG